VSASFSKPVEVRVVGRYALHGIIASGGMATVHFGRQLGEVGFSRTVAIKRLHAHFAADPEFASMFYDEARLAARIRHPNVIPTIDVVANTGELFLVMEYVPGDTLARLSKGIRDGGGRIPHRIVASIVVGVLHGLHAAHEAKDERGAPLGIVHRDVSPQNVHVGTDGVARVLDFGVAKASGRIQTTRDGQIKGKLAYMSPEQLRGADVNRSSDIYAVGVMLWELITGQRLFVGDNEGVVVARVLEGKISAPSEIVMKGAGGSVSERTQTQLQRLDACILRAVSADPLARFATARDMALELEACVSPATTTSVGDWVERNGAEILAERAAVVSEMENHATGEHNIERPSDVQKLLKASKEASASGSQDNNGRPSYSGSSGTGAFTYPGATNGQPNMTRDAMIMAPSNPTQPSTISVATNLPNGTFPIGEPVASPKRKRGLVIGVIALLLLGTVGIAAFLYSKTDKVIGSSPSQPEAGLAQLTETPDATVQPADLTDASPQSEEDAQPGVVLTPNAKPDAGKKWTGNNGGTNNGNGHRPLPPPPPPPTTKPDQCHYEEYMDGPVKKFRQVCGR
jgi:eukaryotic-like serine/threonine-protein kinase